MPAPVLPQRLPVATASGAAAERWQLQLEAADFSAADAVPVRDLAGDWARYRPRSGRNAALQSARLEAVATRGAWELAVTARSSVLLTGSRDAWDVVQAYKQRATPADGRQLVADAQALGVVWAGLRVARSWRLGEAGAAGSGTPGWQLTAAVTPLSLRQLQRTQVSGTVGYSTLAGYAFDAQTRQQNSRKTFSGFGTADATGSGLSTDLGLLWQPAPTLWLNLSAVDLWSRLRVGGVATEDTRFSSATRSVDARGYLDYQPLAHGRDSAQDLRLRLDTQWVLSGGWQPAGWPAGSQWGARWEQQAGVALPGLWAAWPLAGAWAVQVDAVPRLGTLGLGLRGPWASLMLRSSGSTVGQAHALGWQAALRLPW